MKELLIDYVDSIPRKPVNACEWNAQLKTDPGCNSENVFVMNCIGDCKPKE
jgi:hypothetical protein